MQVALLRPPVWDDYALLDSGNGLKLERYGAYRFVRPEPQAAWRPALPDSEWAGAHAVFEPVGDAGGWRRQRDFPERWKLRYDTLQFWVEPTPFRHLGIFPEQSSQWEWARQQLRPGAQVLNLFGYTGLFSLVAAAAGASVTHVDASKKSIAWARDNQLASGLDDCPVRWILDDAQKFVEREGRRGRRYDAIILDPPKYGRGPNGEVWKMPESLPALLEACRQILSPEPLFVILTSYALRLSSVSLYYILEETLAGLGGQLECGELMLGQERMISTSIFARWGRA